MKRPIQKLYPLEVSSTDMDNEVKKHRNQQIIDSKIIDKVDPIKGKQLREQGTENQNSNIVQNNEKRTRSGRLIRPAKRYSDEYC